MPPTDHDKTYDLLLYEIRCVKKSTEATDKKIATVQETLTELRVEVAKDIAGLKVKSGVWGLIGGMIPVLAALAFMLLRE